MKLQRFSATFALVSAIIIFVLSISVSAQRKPTTAKKPPVPAATSLDVKDAKTKVSNQIKNVSKILYFLGTSATLLELSEKDMKAGKLSDKERAAHIRSKQDIQTVIGNVKAGLSELETMFRAKPALRSYMMSVDGITALALQAQDLSSSGQFTDSGRPFLGVIEKLTDTLAALPN